ncbi:HEPN domain-containing protein [Polluticoccus soli]|uniref:ApeA N-terminal domain 1-containing protein n=1 Tax=Polluticoccus soli TaxID=3034150 RepID=UPI0023E140FB|nr:HEPN domain-containing protein [Flavipsychrobacter sp. JY13-12]
MDENIRWKGYFYHPSNKNDQLPGLLTFNQSDGIELELFGHFETVRSVSSREQTILLGFTSEGKKLTLLNCFEDSRGMSLPGFPTSSYSAIYLFVGQHFEGVDQIEFNSCAIEYQDLNYWLDISGFEVPKYNYEINELNVTYRQPDRITFMLKEDWKAEFEFVFNRPFEYWQPHSEVRIRQAPIFKLIPSSLTSFNDFHETYSSFNSFLSINYFSYPKQLSVTFYIDKEADDKHGANFIKVDLYFQRGVDFKNKRHDSRHRFLLEYKNYGEHFDQFVTRWYELEEIVEASISILTETLMNRGNPMELHFISLVQALENYHRRVIDSNKKSLNIRLDEIVSRLPSKVADVLLSSEIDFTKRVTKNRNYYTHYSEDHKKFAHSISELFVLSEKLKLILIVSLMIDLGLAAEKIELYVLTKGMYNFNHIIDAKKYTEFIRENA